MAETSRHLTTILEKIRNDAEKALALLADAEEQRALAWQCTGCGHVKHFTKAVSVEAVARCPRCKSEQFRPVV